MTRPSIIATGISVQETDGATRALACEGATDAILRSKGGTGHLWSIALEPTHFCGTLFLAGTQLVTGSREVAPEKAKVVASKRGVAQRALNSWLNLIVSLSPDGVVAVISKRIVAGSFTSIVAT